MNLVIPWSQLLALIALHASAGKTGHPPFATEVMLRILLLQQIFVHSDSAMEEALHDIPLYREFAKLDAGISRLPVALWHEGEHWPGLTLAWCIRSRQRRPMPTL